MIVFVSGDITLAGAAMVCAEVWTVEDEPDWFVAASLQPGGRAQEILGKIFLASMFCSVISRSCHPRFERDEQAGFVQTNP